LSLSYPQPPTGEPKKRSKLSKARQLAFDLFEQKLSVKEVAKSLLHLWFGATL